MGPEPNHMTSIAFFSYLGQPQDFLQVAHILTGKLTFLWVINLGQNFAAIKSKTFTAVF